MSGLISRIIDDCRTAIKSPPQSAVEQRILYSRLRAYWSRCEYILWNTIAICLLYAFSDSLLNQYINTNNIHFNIIFHLIQLLSVVSYFFTSLSDPGYVKFGDNNNINSNGIEDSENDEEKIMLNILNSSSDNNSDIDAYLNNNNNDHGDGDDNINGNGIITSGNGNGHRSSIAKYIEIRNRTPNDIDYHNNYSKSSGYDDVDVDDTDVDESAYNVIHHIPEYNRNIIIDLSLENSWPSNYCDQCNFIRPIRSKHCFFCGKCISKFDHHCPLVGNCVAGGNYKYFIFFLLFQSIIVLWTFYISLNTLFIVSIDSVHRTTQSETETLYYKHTVIGWILRIIFFIIMFMFLFSIIGLTGFHLYLLLTNQTTMELMRPDSIDKYLFEEIKRKKIYNDRHNNNNDINQQDPDDNIIDDDESASESYYYTFYGNVTSYRILFNEGWLTNLKMVCTGTLKPEWKTPLRCNIRNAD